jgi:spore coat polysaccharide biosynthesis protein SpsF
MMLCGSYLNVDKHRVVAPNQPSIQRALKPIWAVVPGRMGSSRMPGKTMAELAGKPSLSHIIERLRRVPDLDGIVVATTTEPEDDVVYECACTAGVPAYRGSVDDVLARTLEAATWVGAATIVTITGDCPLTDPAIVQHVIEEYRRHRPDFASNALHGYKYPIGISAEVFPRSLLEGIENEATAPRDREHVTLFIYEHPQRFRLLSIEPCERYYRPDLRLTLDTPDDYKLISALYDALYDSDPCFRLDAILDYLDQHLGLVEFNSHIRQVIP